MAQQNNYVPTWTSPKKISCRILKGFVSLQLPAVIRMDDNGCFFCGRFFNSSWPGFPAQLEPMEAMTPIKASASPGASCGPEWNHPTPVKLAGDTELPGVDSPIGGDGQPERSGKGVACATRGCFFLVVCLFVIQRATQKKSLSPYLIKIYEICVKLNSTSPLLRPNNINPEPSTF